METGKYTKKKTIFISLNKKLFIAVILLLAGFFVSQVYVTAQVGTKSAEVEDIRKQKDTIRLENEILSSKIDEAKSLEKVKEVAEKYGLVEKNIQEITPAPNQNDVASNY